MASSSRISTHVSLERQATSNGSDENTPLVSSSGGPAVVGPKHQQRDRRRTTLVLLVVTALLVGGITTGFALEQRKQSDMVESLKQHVEISETGDYQVHYAHNVTRNETLADLAQIMVPGWLVASQMAVSTSFTRSVQPADVQQARKCLLTTRNLLDVFEPVYPGKLFDRLRISFKLGYEVAGNFQDLDHAQVIYDKHLWNERRLALLKWKRGFERVMGGRAVLNLVSHPDPTYCADSSSTASHLFWSDQDVPCASDLATNSLQKLASLQLEHSLDYLHQMKYFDHVLSVEHQEVYHNFRKELRSFLADCSLFGGYVLFQNPTKNDLEALTTLEMARKLLGDMNDHWTAYNLYKERGTHKEEQKELEERINSEWEDFQTWSQKNDLQGTIQSLIPSVQRSQ